MLHTCQSCPIRTLALAWSWSSSPAKTRSSARFGWSNLIIENDGKWIDDNGNPRQNIGNIHSLHSWDNIWLQLFWPQPIWTVGPLMKNQRALLRLAVYYMIRDKEAFEDVSTSSVLGPFFNPCNSLWNGHQAFEKIACTFVQSRCTQYVNVIFPCAVQICAVCGPRSKNRAAQRGLMAWLPDQPKKMGHIGMASLGTSKSQWWFSHQFSHQLTLMFYQFLSEKMSKYVNFRVNWCKTSQFLATDVGHFILIHLDSRPSSWSLPCNRGTSCKRRCRRTAPKVM